MTLKPCWPASSFLAAALLAPALVFGQGDILKVSAAPAAGKKGEVMEVRLKAQLSPGFHANTDKPTDDYMIPMKLTWDAAGAETVEIVFPQGKMEKYAFADKPIAVYSGEFTIVSKLKPKQSGFTLLTGKLRYQACNDNACFPPKTVDVKVSADIR
jgi:hypothetical protein